MIVYQATKASFLEDVLNDQIESKILEHFKKTLNRSTSKQEITSWKNSMLYMDKVLNDSEIPDDCGIAIEYQIPLSANRIDFILTGISPNNTESAILIELKQWSEASLSQKDGVVNTFVGGKRGEFVHPSYQAWSYASLLNNFNQTIEDDKIELQPCAYLHNYLKDNVITNDHYKVYTDKAPVFLRGDALRLRNFIKEHVKHGDKNQILFRIENGKIRPSKMLADSMVGMLKGKPEFVMVDDQKLVYEAAIAMTNKANSGKKEVLIVKGGPGTGKSVVAINILVEITKRGWLGKYVSKNAAPRAVYESKLTGNFRKTDISNMFSGSGAFITTTTDTFNILIVDEAHRLNKFSGLYGNTGENQIKEIISAARCSIFFIDEQQRVTLNDIGTIKEIRRWAAFANANVEEMELRSQFRCNGSDGYLAWVDNALQIRETANLTIEKRDYDFQVFSSPKDLHNAIYEKNKVNNKSRVVAGYCWEWNSKKNPLSFDIVIPRHNYSVRWNLSTDGSLWVISRESVKEAGCIHTCQGLEVDYIGVLIGPDLIVRNGEVLTRPAARAKSDRSVMGYKKFMDKNPNEAAVALDGIIKNTYRTLMTRGMKGCFIYCEDQETEDYFRRQIGGS